MIIFLYGENSFRSRKKLNELKNKYLAEVDPSGAELNTLDGEKSRVADISEAIGPAALFTRKKMIVIENVFQNKDNLAFAPLFALLKKQGGGANANIIVFLDGILEPSRMAKDRGILFDFLKKQRYSHEFKRLGQNELLLWVKNHVSSKGFRINHDALQLLLGLTGNDLWLLDSELNKLISYKQALSGGESDKIIIISREDIGLMVKTNSEAGIFPLTDAVGNKEKALALRLLRDQFDSGAADAYLLAMIQRQFKNLLMIREALDLGLTSRKIANDYNLKSFVVQKGILQARRYSTSMLKSMLRKLADIDSAVKSGSLDVRAGLTEFIALI